MGVAGSVETLIPYDGLVLFQAEPLLRQLRPIFARHPRAEEVYRRGPVEYGVGITGFGASCRPGSRSCCAGSDAPRTRAPRA